MRKASLRSTFVIALMVCFAITGAAAAAPHVDDLDVESLLGRPIFTYDFDVSERVRPTNIRIGHATSQTGYIASRFILGERGAFVELEFESKFFPLHAFTAIEIWDTNAGARIEDFQQEVLWRGSWSDPRFSFQLKFSYQVDGTKYSVLAQDAVITPDYLVVSLNQGYTLLIIKYEVIELIEVVH